MGASQTKLINPTISEDSLLRNADNVIREFIV